ncbi:DUF3006 domain-containing protein [Anaerobacillus sp. MEB173]|uniref:DUF3006 domain-containing protein n=1 Tax=Anaerobacillus sp. MEB173 TaxID=3383345 RepID=UPI003F8DD5C3
MPTYTLDRIEGHMAILLLRSDESIQKDIHIDHLPAGTKEGDLFDVTFEEDGTTVKTITQSKEETNQVKKEADQLMQKILAKNKQ